MRAFLSAEFGATWTILAERLRQTHHELLAVAQEPLESAPTFAERAIGRIKDESPIHCATMLLAHKANVGIDDARRALATALAIAVQTGPLVLVSSHDGVIPDLRGLARRIGSAHGVPVQVQRF